MNLALTVIEIVAPVFLLAGVGFTWVKLGLEYRNQFVTRMAMNLAMPCLIFVSLMQTTIEPTALATLFLATNAVYLAIAVASFLLVRVTGLNQRTYLAPFLIGNTGNLGLPLALFAFGEIGLGYAVVVFAISSIWAFTTVSIWCQGKALLYGCYANRWSCRPCWGPCFCGRVGRHPKL